MWIPIQSSSRKLFWANKRSSNRKRTCEYCSVKGWLPCLNCFPKYQCQPDTHVSKKPRRIANSSASWLRVSIPLSRRLFWANKRSSRRKRSCKYCCVKGWLPCLHCCRRYRYKLGTHGSKKPRNSAIHINLGLANLSSYSAFRLSQYPEPVLRLRREVQASSWKSTSGFKSVFCKDQERGPVGEQTSCIMGNAKSLLFGAFSFRTKGNKAADVKPDAYEEIVISDDSSGELTEITNDGPERESDISQQRLHGADGFVYDSKNRSGKSNMVDEGEEPARMLDSLSLSPKCYPGHVPAHQELLESGHRYDSRPSRLQSDISLQEGIQQSFISSMPVKKLGGEDSEYHALLREPFVPLTKAERNTVLRALSNASRQKVLVTHEDSNIEITGQVLQCLRPGAWLNDEVINVYLELLKERELREPKKFLKCHFFNTFFYKRLTGGGNDYDYKSVRRWTTQKKIGYGLIECDKIFVPIHQGSHWCLAVINNKDKKFQYLDSLGGRDFRVLNVVAQYFVDEVKDKSGEDIDINSWKGDFGVDCPAQMNSSDCGVFMIKYIDFYSRGLGLDFHQVNMAYFRLRTAKEILQLKAN